MAAVHVYQDNFPGEISSDIRKHPRSAERRSKDAEFREIMEEDTAQESNAADTLSGIGAFEASFATPFPESFSPATAAAERNKSPKDKPETAVEEYNPFFPAASPAKRLNFGSPVLKTSTENSDSSVLEGGTRPSGFFNITAPSRSNWRAAYGAVASSKSQDSDNDESPTSTPPSTKHSPTDFLKQLSSGNNGSPPEEAIRRQSNGTRYATPPHTYQSPESPDSEGGPRRPEKSGAAAARARYEKALQPRGSFQGGPRRHQKTSGIDGDAGTVGNAASSGGFDRKLENANNFTSSPASFRVEARLKERALSASVRNTISNLDTKTFSSSMRDVQPQQQPPWSARPSLNKPFGAKSWDDIGEIPMEDSPPNHKNGFSRNGSTTSASSSYTLRALSRNRPWDSSNQPTAESNPRNTTAAQPGPLQQSGSFEDKSFSSSSRFVAAGKSRRRSVKQPVSYAEPSLNSKLRRGDVFFEKKSDDDEKPRSFHRRSTVAEC